jgi:hypothetical protein
MIVGSKLRDHETRMKRIPPLHIPELADIADRILEWNPIRDFQDFLLKT